MMRKTLQIIVALLLGLAVWFGFSVYLGVTGAEVDKPKPTGIELAGLAKEVTVYVVTLTTAILGVVGLIASEMLPDLDRYLSVQSQRFVIAGVIMCCLSLFTGFVSLLAVLLTAADAVVRNSLDRILILQLVQFLELFIGVVLLGWPAVRRVL